MKSGYFFEGAGKIIRAQVIFFRNGFQCNVIKIIIVYIAQNLKHEFLGCINFRKRSVKEKEAIYSDSKSDIVGKLLPVIDNFERAAAAQSDYESYKKGIEMTVKQLLDVFSSLGVEAFGEKGEEFDPNIHNGVMHIDDESLGENVIADVYAKGYKMGDRIIRHATVIVAN